MKIVFKDVGQGDSIVLEWTGDDGELKIGIIDCNLKGRNLNPIVEHLKVRPSIIEIEFIILSHPHKDHYSGLEQLFEYLVDNNIRVKRFAHTLKDQGSVYWWRWFEKNTDDVRLLVRIMRIVKDLKSKQIIQCVQALTENVRIDLAEGMYLRCLSPSHDEQEEYQRLVKIDPDKNLRQASAAANYLATVFKLTVKDKHVLFTSDAEVFSLDRITKHFPEVKAKKFFICQLPHHGSKRNHHVPFWEWLETDENKVAVVSSGQHHQYHHPDYDTVKWFFDNGYGIRATNIVYGMRRLKKELVRKNLLLEGVSSIATDMIVRGDQSFTL